MIGDTEGTFCARLLVTGPVVAGEVPTSKLGANSADGGAEPPRQLVE